MALIGLQATAQELLSPSFTFSHKKTAYITLMDGTELKGNVDKIKREKGLIEEIKFVDGSGKKYKLKAGDVKEMYLPPSGVDKLSRAMNIANDARKWNNESMNSDLLNKNYVYFENAQVKIKKKELTLLMQLLNPTFSKSVKVYHDPYAKETASLGVGGVKVAGGDAKSYFIALNNQAAFKLTKKKYKEEFLLLWKTCGQMKTSFPDIKWTELTQHITTFTDCQ